MSTKMCSKCKVEKPSTSEFFSKNSKYKDGFACWCKACNRIACAAWHQRNTEYVSRKNLEKYHRDRDLIISRVARYNKRRASEDIQFRLRANLRSRLRSAIANSQKTGSAVRDLGCSIEELKFYLESRFSPGMSWSNYGNKMGQWSIDHIVPLSKFNLTNREELLKAVHYTNLQPLWQKDNCKKSNH